MNEKRVSLPIAFLENGWWRIRLTESPNIADARAFTAALSLFQDARKETFYPREIILLAGHKTAGKKQYSLLARSLSTWKGAGFLDCESGNRGISFSFPEKILKPEAWSLPLCVYHLSPLAARFCEIFHRILNPGSRESETFPHSMETLVLKIGISCSRMRDAKKMIVDAISEITESGIMYIEMVETEKGMYRFRKAAKRTEVKPPPKCAIQIGRTPFVPKPSPVSEPAPKIEEPKIEEKPKEEKKAEKAEGAAEPAAVKEMFLGSTEGPSGGFDDAEVPEVREIPKEIPIESSLRPNLLDASAEALVKERMRKLHEAAMQRRKAEEDRTKAVADSRAKGEPIASPAERDAMLKKIFAAPAYVPKSEEPEAKETALPLWPESLTELYDAVPMVPDRHEAQSRLYNTWGAGEAGKQVATAALCYMVKAWREDQALEPGSRKIGSFSRLLSHYCGKGAAQAEAELEKLRKIEKEKKQMAKTAEEERQKRRAEDEAYRRKRETGAAAATEFIGAVRSMTREERSWLVDEAKNAARKYLIEEGQLPPEKIEERLVNQMARQLYGEQCLNYLNQNRNGNPFPKELLLDFRLVGGLFSETTV